MKCFKMYRNVIFKGVLEIVQVKKLINILINVFLELVNSVVYVIFISMLCNMNKFCDCIIFQKVCVDVGESFNLEIDLY